VARNRKRRSERRPRRPSDDAISPPGVATAKAARRDERDESPDPIEHATPDVELAEAQLAIGRPELPLDASEQDGFTDDELTADELDGGRGGDDDFGSRGGGGGGGAGSGSGGGLVPGSASTPSPRGPMRLVGFLQGSWRELQRVQWPDRRQVMQATGVVIGFVIVAGVFLGVADVIATKLVNLILK
jgi:preprotein translocase subunit SecE